MPRFTVALACSAFGLIAGSSLAQTGYDGKWYVTLRCSSIEDKRGPVNGYELNFPATVTSGRLSAQYGAPGTPNSLTYDGEVSADGVLQIKASGHTGPSANTLGRVAQGTPFTYTLRGKLTDKGGEATRVEGRPCVASFSR